MAYESIISMFNDVLEFEESALKIYGQIMLNLKNDEIKKIIHAILEDEARHAQNAREILRILNS